VTAVTSRCDRVPWFRYQLCDEFIALDRGIFMASKTRIAGEDDLHRSRLHPEIHRRLVRSRALELQRYCGGLREGAGEPVYRSRLISELCRKLLGAPVVWLRAWTCTSGAKRVFDRRRV